MQSFDELLQMELTKPMELKQNGVKVGQITPLEAMVKSIVTKAGKGDIAAINVVRNMTRKPTQDDADETARREAAVNAYEQQLTAQFKGEKVYDGQDNELRMLAESRYMVDVLARRIQQADFEPLITEYTQSGGTKQSRNPIIDMHKEAKKQFDADLSRLRQEAIQRIITRRNMKL
jgi:negative regulator of genetic competence, sporulation and motility